MWKSVKKSYFHSINRSPFLPFVEWIKIYQIGREIKAFPFSSSLILETPTSSLLILFSFATQLKEVTNRLFHCRAGKESNSGCILGQKIRCNMDKSQIFALGLGMTMDQVRVGFAKPDTQPDPTSFDKNCPKSGYLLGTPPHRGKLRR